MIDLPVLSLPQLTSTTLAQLPLPTPHQGTPQPLMPPVPTLLLSEAHQSPLPFPTCWQAERQQLSVASMVVARS